MRFSNSFSKLLSVLEIVVEPLDFYQSFLPFVFWLTKFPHYEVFLVLDKTKLIARCFSRDSLSIIPLFSSLVNCFSASFFKIFLWLFYCLSAIKNRQRPTFPGSFPPSIIGAKELNFCVRDGNRCVLPAIVTGFVFILFLP